jgi:hypothetical protein
MKKLLVALAALSVCACASPSNPAAMVAAASPDVVFSSGSALHQNVELGTVDGGRETNPLWTSQVSSEDFAEALRGSFQAHAILTTQGGDYRLDATLMELNQPFAGLDMSVHSTVRYALTEVASGDVVYEEVISERYTATMGDAFVGVERLRLANEGSIRANIERLISQLHDQFGAGAAPAATADVVAP